MEGESISFENFLDILLYNTKDAPRRDDAGHLF